MPTWVIKRVKALATNDGQDLANGNELLFVDLFSNDNDFASAPHESGIAGVSQDDDDQDDDNGNGNINTDEDPGDPPGIALYPIVSRGKISRVPPTENPVELP